MARRTIHLSESVESLILESAAEDESFSAAVARLVEQGAAAAGPGPRRPSYVGVGDGPRDLGERAEQYLNEPVPSE